MHYLFGLFLSYIGIVMLIFFKLSASVIIKTVTRHDGEIHEAIVVVVVVVVVVFLIFHFFSLFNSGMSVIFNKD